MYKEKGFDDLLTTKYGNNKSKLENHSENILDSFLQRPPMNAAEAVQRISEMTDINRSDQQVRAFMKRHGLKFIKCGHIPAKADNEAQHQWAETAQTCYSSRSRRAGAFVLLRCSTFCTATLSVFAMVCFPCFYQSFCW